jgi:predicted  nucleic acid-binding Zn-ribbon protein
MNNIIISNNYRKDIDGLRAIAILAVILFHSNFLPNGYLGVDVFLVISGYLITKIEVINYYKKNASKLYEQIKDLKQNINNVLEEIASINENFRKMKNETIQMQKQYKEYKQKYEELKDSRETDMKGVEKELVKASKGIPVGLMEKYKQKRNDKMFPVLYEVNGKRCSQCGMELSLSELNNLGKEKIIECENCRRLIYTKE